MRLKKWIVKQLLNCKWLKEALYEALYKEYVEKLRKKNIDLMNELDETKLKLRSTLNTLNNKIKELDGLKDDLVKAFPVGKFEDVIKKLKSIADKILPLLNLVKVEEVSEPVKKPKRKYNKKKKVQDEVLHD